MNFVESVAMCALLLRTRTERLVSQRLLKGQFNKLYEDLQMHPQKLYGFFRMTCSSFDELLSMVVPKITYRNTVMRASVPPEERLAITLRLRIPAWSHNHSRDCTGHTGSNMGMSASRVYVTEKRGLATYSRRFV